MNPLMNPVGSKAEGKLNCINAVVITQSNCLICLPDKSGNFLAFRAKTAQNTVKPEKTGFGMVNETAPGPVFCVFRPKISRTFYFKLTEQSSRKKLAEGGFEPEKVRLLYPAPKIPYDSAGFLLFTSSLFTFHSDLTAAGFLEVKDKSE